MAVKLRLRRMGRTKAPLYAVIATDSRSPRDGRYIEDLGRYEPVREPAVVSLKADRILYWLQMGAQPTDTVRNLLSDAGIMYHLHLLRKGKTAEEIEATLASWKETKAAQGEKKVTAADRSRQALEAERKKAEADRARIEKERKEAEARLRAEAEAAARAEAEARAAAQAAAAAAEAEANNTTEEAVAVVDGGGTSPLAVASDAEADKPHADGQAAVAPDLGTSEAAGVPEGHTEVTADDAQAVGPDASDLAVAVAEEVAAPADEAPAAEAPVAEPATDVVAEAPEVQETAAEEGTDDETKQA